MPSVFSVLHTIIFCFLQLYVFKFALFKNNVQTIDGFGIMIRFPRSVEDFTRIQVQGAPKICNVAKQPFAGR